MPDLPPAALLAEVANRGLIAPGTALRLHRPGNRDRRPTRQRSWIGTDTHGRSVILTLGPGLAARARTQSDFARACPELVRPTLACFGVGNDDLLAEEYIEGRSLDSLDPSKPGDARLIDAAFAAACRALAATQRNSTEPARQREWSEWADGLCALPCWSPAEAGLLRGEILPRLYPLVARDRPVTRWSNGDFTAGNLLLAAHGRVALIDLEHARETHFFTEDASRFHALSAIARARPELFVHALPRPGPAWHLYFWLRQIGLESAANTVSYWTGVRSHRLGVVRRLAEQVLDLELANWSVPPERVEFTIEQARWPGDATPRLVLSGWACAPDGPTACALVVHTTDGKLLAESPLQDRPDVEAHFAGSAGSRQSGFATEFLMPGPDPGLQLSLLDGNGVLLPFARLRTGELPGRGPFIANYAEWAVRYDPDPTPPRVGLPAGPRFSVLLPVYRSDPVFLRACVESVLAQHYPHWELIMVDDGSASPGLTSLLRELAGFDRRIRTIHRADNRGIARTTNEALAAARGDFVVLLDHDDLLRPHALAELAAALDRDPAIDALYSDEEKISATGARLLPFFKPAFSPEFLRGVMYPGHVLCVRRTAAERCGGFDSVFDGVQDFEFFLRLSETGARIVHLPRILYQWRQAPTSSALHGNIKGDMDRKQAAAVQAHLQRTGDTRRAVALGGHRLRLESTTAPHFEVVVCTDPAAAVALLRKAAATSTAEALVLWPRAATPGDEAALRELAALAARPDSGCVGPLLITPAGRVVASGLTRVGGELAPLMAGFDATTDGYNGALRCNREVHAVPPTGAALRRALLTDATAGDDWAGFSRQLAQRGLFHRVCAGARLAITAEPVAVRANLGTDRPDPFYNPHFAPPPASYQLARPPVHLPAPRPQAIFHVDELPPAMLNDGCATVRGWCLRRDGLPASVRIRSGRLSWTAVCALPRPDVARAHPAGLTDGNCGFALRFRLPAGRHELIVESISSEGAAEHLLSHRVDVHPCPALRRMIAPHAPTLLAHQLPAWPVHPPRWLRPEQFPATGPGALPLRIVTPSYQQAAFLDETIRSVLHDAPAGLHYVIQDGGSTDGSPEIIARWARNYPGAGNMESGERRKENGEFPSPSSLLPSPAGGTLAWSSEPDAGQADAIAKGFAKTSGGPDDIMAWINSDDFYLPGALKFVAAYFARHPDVDVVYGHRVLLDEQSREIGRWFLPKHDPEVLRLNDFVPQETLFWRRRIWDKVGGIDTSFKFAMDWDLLLRFQAAGAKIVRVPYFLACFRIHAAQKTSAQIHSVGQAEIDRLRERTFGRPIATAELESNPRLIRYLRKSALIELLWKLGFRAP
jgi:glycosyltransferase involved in cell wall biosynthesis